MAAQKQPAAWIGKVNNKETCYIAAIKHAALPQHIYMYKAQPK